MDIHSILAIQRRHQLLGTNSIREPYIILHNHPAMDNHGTQSSTHGYPEHTDYRTYTTTPARSTEGSYATPTQSSYPIGHHRLLIWLLNLSLLLTYL
jgi:hypothetical protein